MIAPFDIFRTGELGLRWMGAAETLDEAKARVEALGRSEPGEYFIFSQKTGNRVLIKANGHADKPPEM